MAKEVHTVILRVLFFEEEHKEEVYKGDGHFGQVQECPEEIFLTGKRKTGAKAVHPERTVGRGQV